MPYKDPVVNKQYQKDYYWRTLATRPRHPFGNRFVDISSQKFGKLTAEYPIKGTGKRGVLWHCVCECGGVLDTYASRLREGEAVGCGCMRGFRHGSARVGKQTPENRAYHAAKNRCTNPKGQNWKNYGGRGIEFRFLNFPDFLDELGSRPSSRHSIDRIDNEGHYEVGNVRWSTRVEQNRNKRKRAA